MTDQREPSEQEDQIVIALRRIMRAVDLHSRRLVHDHGLTGPQLVVLRTVVRDGPLAAGTLARLVQLSGATVTGIVSRLEARGLLRRRRSETDRRSVLVESTELGARSLVRAPSLLQDRFRDQLATLADWERTSILAALQRMASMMDAEDVEAAPHLHLHSNLAAESPAVESGAPPARSGLGSDARPGAPTPEKKVP